MIKTLGKWTTEPLSLDNIIFPSNLTMKYVNNDKMTINSDTIYPQKIYDMRKAAEAHRQVRRDVQSFIKPNTRYYDICERIDNKIRQLLGNDEKGGIGFPTGLSSNNIAAHDSANPNDNRIVKENDILKVDIGTHVNGNIIDSAFTVCFNNDLKPLVESTREATWEAIKMAGPDAYVKDISNKIQEVIESYEVTINGKDYQIHSVPNLGGHNISPYKIHSGKLLLGSNSQFTDPSMRMEVNECWAIETFATTGKGPLFSTKNLEVNHYAINIDATKSRFKLKNTGKLLSYIKKTRSTLPFCTRWLEKEFPRYKPYLNDLVNSNIVTSYPPLIDLPFHKTSQWEHTIYLHDYGKEIMSFGDDY
ncbi:MAG: type II methionyl aminopeptidase [Magnetococcales bacterium]|nr:type II methionyl aminopeptidase [Magnetococcales bacterium]|tara:strand:+ start:102578 stop:103663 length:1086 start_codon:yes stop_codon:yes gene_type:complete